MITPTENGISVGTPSQMEDDLRREAAMVPMSLEQRMLFLGAGLASLEARVIELEHYRQERSDHLTAIAWHLEQLRAAK